MEAETVPATPPDDIRAIVDRIIELLSPTLPGLLIEPYHPVGGARVVEGVTVRLPAGEDEHGFDVIAGAYVDGAHVDALMVTSKAIQGDDGVVRFEDRQCYTVDEVVASLREYAVVQLRRITDEYATTARVLAPIAATIDGRWTPPPLAADHKGLRLSLDGFTRNLVEDLRGLVRPWHVELECEAVQEGLGWVCTWAVEVTDSHQVEDARVFRRLPDVEDEEVSTPIRRKGRTFVRGASFAGGTSVWEATVPGPGTYVLQASWNVDADATRDRLDEFTPAADVVLEELLKHLHETARRFYAGDVAAVDELFQLYCLDEHRQAVGLGGVR